MSKRFTETMKWDDPWFMALPDKYKLLWLYIVDKCDNAGVWKINLIIASAHIGHKLAASDLLYFNDEEKDRVKLFNNDRSVLIREFVKFQIMDLNAIDQDSKLTNLQKSCIALVCKYIADEELTENDYGILTGKLPVVYDIATGIGKGKGKGIDKGNVNNREEEDVISWRDNYNLYYDDCKSAMLAIMSDDTFIKGQEKFHPDVDISLSIEKAFINFWGTPAGWKHKKKSKSGDIDWPSTFRNAIDKNRVFKPKQSIKKRFNPSALLG